MQVKVKFCTFTCTHTIIPFLFLLRYVPVRTQKSAKSTLNINFLPPPVHPQALDNVPLLLYILALKTLLLCLAFAGVKIYQGKKVEEAMKREQAEKSRLAQQTQDIIDDSDKKDN